MRERFMLPGYDWSNHEGPDSLIRPARTHIKLNDEAFRDGQQALVETEPEEATKQLYIKSTANFAEKIDLGFPGNNAELKQEIIRLAKFIRDNNIDIKPMVTGRGPVREDIEPILDIASALNGFEIEAYIFLDSSKERAKHQGWNREEMIKRFVENTKLLVAHNVPVGLVLERWSRTSPDDQREFADMVLGEGARFFILADTQGVHNERSLKNELRWTFDTFGKKYPDTQFDAHFHNQRGLALANSLIAASEGIDRIHVTPGGIGEGAGNTDYVSLLVNLNMDGYRNDTLKGCLSKIKESYEIFGIEVPRNAPFHKGAFESASGVHQDTFYKAVQMLEGLSLYFCISPEEVGEQLTVLLNRMSGRNGVRYVLEIQEHLKTTPEMIEAVLMRAKNSRSVLSKETILETALNCIEED